MNYKIQYANIFFWLLGVKEMVKHNNTHSDK